VMACRVANDEVSALCYLRDVLAPWAGNHATGYLLSAGLSPTVYCRGIIYSISDFGDYIVVFAKSVGSHHKEND
jgi:hypothetical protein